MVARGRDVRGVLPADAVEDLGGPDELAVGLPPTTTILPPTTPAAAAARGWLSLGSSFHAPFCRANTRSDTCAVRFGPLGTQPPITTGSPL